ncbi:MAG: SCP2 sterol-binding domain-containing protein [Nitrososphaerales archaeon]
MPDNFAVLEKVVKRFSEKEVQKNLKGFSKTMQFVLTDVKEEYLITIKDGKEAHLERTNVPKPDILITTTSNTLEKIVSKSINPAAAYFARKISIKAPMDDMLKLRKVFG